MLRSILVAFLVLGPAAMPPALAQGQALVVRTYDPGVRTRFGIDSCRKAEEVVHGNQCVKKCQDGFRLELKGKAPLCVATRNDARYVEPTPGYKTPEKALAKGAKGA